jgi:hypothetical protein
MWPVRAPLGSGHGDPIASEALVVIARAGAAGRYRAKLTTTVHGPGAVSRGAGNDLHILAVAPGSVHGSPSAERGR